MIYQKITEYLNICVEKDFLSHAYIFHGPDESAKKTIILKFVNKILNADFNSDVSEYRGFNPDLILISADADEERSINLIRQLKRFLILSPYHGKYKIAIISAAEKLNIYAQNALLKIFEEAPNHAIIVINVRTIDSIPETIASRAVKLAFWRQNNINQLDEKIIEIFNEILAGDFKDRYYIFEKLNDYTTIEIFKSWLWYLRTKFLFDQNQKHII